ncbi:MAG: hypothetical protein KME25_29795 [Symplocastrum torsivum CPER-KK1]|uniref:Uncharacterized protein n=1 Tax=Symplocastrum torsivum CPER-KK1 TaxID=450513 RepID=A0A951PST7_9CYAN|nr:hypothetical protein [Symplocastrum torsivum CPER-KK1]
MSQEQWSNLGQQFRKFLLGLVSESNQDVKFSNPSEPTPDTSMQRSTYSGQTSNEAQNSTSGNYGSYGGTSSLEPTIYAEIDDFNPGAILKPGNLLVTFQPRKACYQIDPESGDVEFLFSLRRKQGLFLWRAIADREGNIYCSYSGNIIGQEPYQRAIFGTSGGVVRINYRRTDRVVPLAEDSVNVAVGDNVVDPLGMEFLENNRILVADFNGFGGTGFVYIINRFTGVRERTISSSLFIDPIKAVLDNDGFIWVANADQASQDGDVVCIDPNGKQTIIVQRQGKSVGALVDILQSQNPDELILIRDSLPALETSAILIMNKRNGEFDSIITASRGLPRFYSQGYVDGNYLWVAESYENKILRIDLTTRSITQEIDATRIRGGIRGFRSSYDVIESISVIPKDVKQK